MAGSDTEDWEEPCTSQLRYFLQCAKPEWTGNELFAIEDKLTSVGIGTVASLVQALDMVNASHPGPPRVRLNEMLRSEGAKPFTTATLSALRAQAQRFAAAGVLIGPTTPKARGQIEPPPYRGIGAMVVDERFSQQPAWQLGSMQPPPYKGVGAGVVDDRYPQEPVWCPGTTNAADGETQWFEVLKSVIFAKEVPDKDAKTIGILKQGELFEVSPTRALDGDGHPWVELTDLSQLHSFNGGEDSRAYALISGRHIGLGPLLRGPVPRPAARAARPSPPPAAPAEAAAAGRPADEAQLPGSAGGRGSSAAGAAAPAPVAEGAGGSTARQRSTAKPLPQRLDPESLIQPSRERERELRPTPQSFVVVRREGLAVHERPTEDSSVLFRLAEGSTLTGEEETFNAWVKIAGEAGWARRCMRERGELVVCFRPCDGAPTVAAAETLVRPGPRRFEVAYQQGLDVKAAPSESAAAVGSRAFNETVEAASQTFDGWVRLANGSGWLPAFGREAEVLLRSSLEDEAATEEWLDRVKVSKSVLHWAQNRTPSLGGLRSGLLDDTCRRLQYVASTGDVQELRAAIIRARAFGLEGDELAGAEARLQELYRDPAAGRAEPGAPPRRGAGGRRAAAAEEAEGPEAEARAAALERLARAAAAGDSAELRAAAVAAKAVGVPKREIARAHALHSGEGAFAG